MIESWTILSDSDWIRSACPSTGKRHPSPWMPPFPKSRPLEIWNPEFLFRNGFVRFEEAARVLYNLIDMLLRILPWENRRLSIRG